MSIRRVERYIRNLRRNVEEMGIAKDAQSAEREPTQAERQAEADRTREGLWAKLRIASDKGTHMGGPEGDVTLTSPLAIELAHRFGKQAESVEASRKAARAEFLKRTAGRWTRLLRGEPEKVEQDEKVIPIASAKSGGGWAGMSAAEDDYPDPDSYFNLLGSSESEIWREAYRRYGPSE